MNKFSYQISQDFESPIKNSLFTWTMAHGKYNFEKYDPEFDSRKYLTWDEVRNWLENDRDAHIIVKISAIDHSSFHVYAGNPKEWDSGVIGFVWIDYDKFIQCFGEDSQKSIDQVYEMMNNEIKAFDAYLNGDYYEATVYQDGKATYSCGSFTSKEDAEKWAKENIEKMKENDCGMIQMEFSFI